MSDLLRTLRQIENNFYKDHAVRGALRPIRRQTGIDATILVHPPEHGTPDETSGPGRERRHHHRCGDG